MNPQQVFEECLRDQHFGVRGGLEARDWQLKCLAEYRQSVADHHLAKPTDQHRFTIYAGTGAGKTKTAGMIAGFLLNHGHIEQLVVVSPTICIKKKTRDEFMAWFNIDLAPRLTGNLKRYGVPRGQQGYILTYQALMMDPDLHRRLRKRTKTLVIFDEVHHLGDESDWGEGADRSFGDVEYVIALTGTPFRSDNRRVPFVSYLEDAATNLSRFVAKPPFGFTYSLGSAVADGVCRKPQFIFFEGTTEIRSSPAAGFKTVSTRDVDVNQETAASRLRGLVQHPSTCRTAMLKQALQESRHEHRKVIIFLGGDSGGDMKPTEDATTYLPVELEELGYGLDEIEVIIGSDKSAQDKIDSFGLDPKKWILISINMVSEGTDIPQLSAAVFLTNVTSKQTTVQRIGRVLRLRDGDQCGTANIYMFQDPDLISLASEIEKEIQSEVKLRERRRREQVDDGDAKPRFREEVRAVGDSKPVMVAFNGREWDAELFYKTKEKFDQRGLPYTLMQAALALDLAEVNGVNRV